MPAAAAATAVALGCGSYGNVNQGQVVEYDGAKGVMVLVADSNYRNPAPVPSRNNSPWTASSETNTAASAAVLALP